MIKLKIYGRLRKFIGQSEFLIKANSAKEAFSFLINNYPEVREHIKDQEYCVMAGDIRLTEELLDMQTNNEIKIIPVVHGEIIPIIVGGLLSGLGAGATIFGLTLGIKVQAIAASIGLNMLIGGVTDLLSPDPQPINQQRQEDPRDQGFSFTGLLNNSKHVFSPISKKCAYYMI